MHILPSNWQCEITVACLTEHLTSTHLRNAMTERRQQIQDGDISLTSMVTYSMSTVMTGNAKYGSETVKSVNHAKPPVFILSTGKLAI